MQQSRPKRWFPTTLERRHNPKEGRENLKSRVVNFGLWTLYPGQDLLIHEHLPCLSFLA